MKTLFDELQCEVKNWWLSLLLGILYVVVAVSLMFASDNSELANYTGDSFRDLTRIAHINDKMWAELFLWNKDNLISEIDMFSDALATMRQKLVDDDREGLEKMFRLSTERRKAFDKK